MDAFVREQADSVQGSSRENIERDVGRMNPRSPVKFQRYPDRGARACQIEDYKNDQPDIMPGPDLTQRFNEAGIKVETIGHASFGTQG